MTNLDRMDELASELFKFTMSMSDSEASERLQEISEKVLAKRADKDKLYEEFPHFLSQLQNNGIAHEPLVLHYMQCSGHEHRFSEVQLLGREMFAAKHSIPFSFTQTGGAPHQIIPQPTPPSPNINSMVNPLLPMNMPMAGHTPCLVTKMDNGQIFMTPMQPSPSPIGAMSPMLPVLPGTRMQQDGMMNLPMPIHGFAGGDMLEMPELPELSFERSKSMPQTSLKINVLEDSIKAPVPWTEMQNAQMNQHPMQALPSMGGMGAPLMPMPMPQLPQRSRSRSRENEGEEMPLPVGNRSPSRERERPQEPELMKKESLQAPMLMKQGMRSNSVPMPRLKGNRSSRTSSGRRRRRNKQPTKRELAEAKLKELAYTYGDRFTRTGMRGENVLRLKAKTKRALENIVPFMKFLDDRVTLAEISCPLSKPAKNDVRGFLAYIRTETVQEAIQVHGELFPLYCAEHTTSDGTSPFKLIELNPMAKSEKQKVEAAKRDRANSSKSSSSKPQTRI